MNIELSKVTISSEYLKILAGLLVMGLQYVMIGVSISQKRKSIFNLDFMKKHFGAEHKKATGQEIQAGGYPDMGEGRYSKKLSETQWLELANAQRGHGNYTEWITLQYAIYLIAGLFTPVFTLYCLIATIVGRFVYTFGYKVYGPNGRMVGAAIYELPLLLNVVTTLYHAGKIAFF